MPDTNRTIKQQKMAGGLKFRIYKVEGLYYPCSEKKALINYSQHAVSAQLIYAFVFAYAKTGFLMMRLKPVKRILNLKLFDTSYSRYEAHLMLVFVFYRLPDLGL